mgnify:CR=1 FL=1
MSKQIDKDKTYVIEDCKDPMIPLIGRHTLHLREFESEDDASNYARLKLKELGSRNGNERDLKEDEINAINQYVSKSQELRNIKLKRGFDIYSVEYGSNLIGYL